MQLLFARPLFQHASQRAETGHVNLIDAGKVSNQQHLDFGKQQNITVVRAPTSSGDKFEVKYYRRSLAASANVRLT